MEPLLPLSPEEGKGHDRSNARQIGRGRDDDAQRRFGMKVMASATFALAITVAACALTVRVPARSEWGASGELSDADLEALFLSVPNNDSAKEHLFRITEGEHIAGTPEGLKVALYVQEELAKALEAPGAGVSVSMDAVKVLLAYPVNRSVSMRAGDTTYSAPLSEPELPSDATSGSRWRNKTFNAYSPSGNVDGELVYANYGNPDDFDALDKIGVSVKGKVVLVRYGGTFRGLKVMNAERRGALGVIIYSDPMEDGYSVGTEYPEGPWRGPQAVQRGSVQFNSLCAGDPARLYSNRTTLELCGYRPQDLIPKIPVLPMSWSDALPLLRALLNPAGVKSPPDFQGALPLEYQTGPGPARVQLQVENDIRPGLIHNIYATIPGLDFGTAADRQVVVGNHRDAWVFGAVDPNSGTAALLEVARGFGELLRRGWRPRRTIVLCSWDGEEYGLLGSTAWAETRAGALLGSAVAYLNCDVGVGGRNLSVQASPLLAPLVRAAVAVLTDPHSGQALSEVWDGWIGDLGSGSDYTVFLDRLGIPSLDLSFRRKGDSPIHDTHVGYGVYHSVYDSFSYVEQQVDPDFKYHALQAQLWGLIALRMSNERVVPLAPYALGDALDRYVAYVRALMRGAGCWGHCSNIKSLAVGNAGTDPTPYEHVPEKSFSQPQKMMFSEIELAPLDEAVLSFQQAALAPDLLQELELCARTPSGTPVERVPPHGRQDADAGAGMEKPEKCGRARLARLNDALLKVERAFLTDGGLPGRKWFRHVLQAPGLYLGYGADLFPGICQALRDGNVSQAQEQVGVCAERVGAAVAALRSWKTPA